MQTSNAPDPRSPPARAMPGRRPGLPTSTPLQDMKAVIGGIVIALLVTSGQNLLGDKA